MIHACHSCIASPTMVAWPASVLLTPSAAFLHSSSGHEIMLSLTSSTVLNSAQWTFLEAGHSSPTPESRGRVFASMQGARTAPRASPPIACQQSLGTRFPEAPSVQGKIPWVDQPHLCHFFITCIISMSICYLTRIDFLRSQLIV